MTLTERLKLRSSGWIPAVVCASALAGCVQIEETVVLNEDGSGKIIEIVRYDDRIVQASKAAPELASLTDLLKEDRLKERMAAYGEVTLVSHVTKDLHANGCESTTVFAFKDISRIGIPAFPNRGTNWDQQTIRMALGKPEMYHEAWRNAYYVRSPLRIFFSPEYQKATPAADPRSPGDREKLRALLPVLRALLQDLRLVLKVETFEPIGNSRTHVICQVTSADFADDERLMKVLEWNRYPDKDLQAVGRIMNEDYTVYISRPTTHTTLTAEKGEAGK